MRFSPPPSEATTNPASSNSWVHGKLLRSYTLNRNNGSFGLPNSKNNLTDYVHITLHKTPNAAGISRRGPRSGSQSGCMPQLGAAHIPVDVVTLDTQ